MNWNDLIALNDQIRALVRAGVPLDEGLAAVACDAPGHLADKFESLARRLGDGEDLARVLAEPSWGLPPAYQAVVAAGSRAGRLAVALEGVATSARLQRESRRQAVTALLYPLIVLYIAYALFVVLTVQVLPTMLAAHLDLIERPAPWSGWVDRLAANPWSWAPWPPLLLTVLLAERWWRAGRGTAAALGRNAKLAWSPRRARQLSGLATFAEVLALLVEHQVPLVEALPLAADASGVESLCGASERVAERLRRGDVVAATGESELPAWLRWLLANPSPRLPEQLRTTARQYRDEANRIRSWLARFMPIGATLVVGGLAVLAYSLLFFVPFTELLGSLGNP